MSAMYRTEPGLGLKIQGGLGLSGPGFRGWGLGAVFLVNLASLRNHLASSVRGVWGPCYVV